MNNKYLIPRWRCYVIKKWFFYHIWSIISCIPFGICMFWFVSGMLSGELTKMWFWEIWGIIFTLLLVSIILPWSYFTIYIFDPEKRIMIIKGLFKIKEYSFENYTQCYIENFRHHLVHVCHEMWIVFLTTHDQLERHRIYATYWLTKKQQQLLIDEVESIILDINYQTR